MNDVIKKLVLQLDGKEIELSIEDAKKLHEALNEMFDRKVITVERHTHHDYSPWRWTYTAPTVLPTTYDPYKITCGSAVSVSYKPHTNALMLSMENTQA